MFMNSRFYSQVVPLMFVDPFPFQQQQQPTHDTPAIPLNADMHKMMINFVNDILGVLSHYEYFFISAIILNLDTRINKMRQKP